MKRVRLRSKYSSSSRAAWVSRGVSPSSAPSDPFGGYGAPPADGDQFAELSTDDGNLPF